jgi:hypothetical protein
MIATGRLTATLLFLSMLLQPALAQDACLGADDPLFDQARVNSQLETDLHSLFACVQDQAPAAGQQNDLFACNWFVGAALAKFWGRTEFFLSPVGRYMTTDELVAIPEDGWSNMGWTVIGPALDQDALSSAEDAAFRGDAVVALGAGHVAVILPGGLASSSDWKLNVPRAAQLKINDFDHAFVGCRLSRSWKSGDAAEVRLLSAPPQ